MLLTKETYFKIANKKEFEPDADVERYISILVHNTLIIIEIVVYLS